MLTKYTGREIATQIERAVEAIPDEHTIVTFKAGENMPITCCFIAEGDVTFFPEYAWDGETWIEIGYL